MPHLVRQPGQRTRAAGNARCAAVLWEWRALHHGEEQQERHPLQGWGERCGLGGLSCCLAGRGEYREPQVLVLGLDEGEAVREHVGVLGEEGDAALEQLDVLLRDFAGSLRRESVLQHALHLSRVVVVTAAHRGVHGRRGGHHVGALHRVWFGPVCVLGPYVRGHGATREGARGRAVGARGAQVGASVGPGGRARLGCLGECPCSWCI